MGNDKIFCNGIKWNYNALNLGDKAEAVPGDTYNKNYSKKKSQISKLSHYIKKYKNKRKIKTNANRRK